MVASADDIEALCKIVNGNLKESTDRGGKVVMKKTVVTDASLVAWSCGLGGNPECVWVGGGRGVTYTCRQIHIVGL